MAVQELPLTYYVLQRGAGTRMRRVAENVQARVQDPLECYAIERDFEAAFERSQEAFRAGAYETQIAEEGSLRPELIERYRQQEGARAASRKR
jgi:hypothetical protein